MGDGTGLAEALLGLDGFEVLAVSETPAKVVIEIETTVTTVGLGGVRDPGRGARADGGGDPRSGRHGSTLARSSTTMAARPLRLTSRYFLVLSNCRPPMSMVSSSAF